jgi:hypothetical protein
LPGQGVVFGTVGRLVLLYSADNELLDMLHESGETFSNVAAICAALAP